MFVVFKLTRILTERWSNRCYSLLSINSGYLMCLFFVCFFISGLIQFFEKRNPILLLLCMSRSGDPPWILKQDWLESSGQRLISSNGKTTRIAFCLQNLFLLFENFILFEEKSVFFLDFFNLFHIFRFFFYILNFFFDFLVVLGFF